MQATATTRHLDIDGMTGEHCVNKVTGALKGLNNVSTQSVKVGSAVIGADKNGCDAACTAIHGVGYKARESQRTNQNDRMTDDGAKTKPANSPTGDVSREQVPANSADHKTELKPEHKADHKTGDHGTDKPAVVVSGKPVPAAH
jgi:copper chaperone CopZ